MKGRIPSVYSVSKARRVFTGICLWLFTMVGVISGGIGIAEIGNYIHPWYFGLLFGLAGGAIGWLLAKLFQKNLLVNRTLQREYWKVIFLLATSFAGFFVLFGAIFNSKRSHVKYCNGYVLEAKGESLGRNNNPIHGNLGFMINGGQTIIGCSMNYYNQVTIYQNITVCYYKGVLGFDFYSLPNDTTWKNR